MSIANQKVLTINKDECIWPFLQIQESDWIRASQELSPSAFKIYLYLAQNKHGYQFNYSPQAMEHKGLMSKGTATKARQELELKEYIVDNVFYVRPPRIKIEYQEKREHF